MNRCVCLFVCVCARARVYVGACVHAWESLISGQMSGIDGVASAALFSLMLPNYNLPSLLEELLR